VIGLGNIGKVVAREFARSGEPVVLASRRESDAAALADELSAQASATTVAEAIAEADVIVLAVWFDVMKELIEQHREALSGKVAIDPSNPIAVSEEGEVSRTLPDGVSSGSVIAGLLPPGAHFVKAFGTVSAASLASGANRDPRRAVLFYATDDDIAAVAAEQLISAAGFDPVKAGGLEASLNIEAFGELHETGGLNGKLLDRDEAEAAVARLAA
jgi:8-hydroxy-5-deazaflavin:NADPH oxidoreductase